MLDFSFRKYLNHYFTVTFTVDQVYIYNMKNTLCDSRQSARVFAEAEERCTCLELRLPLTSEICADKMGLTVTLGTRWVMRLIAAVSMVFLCFITVSMYSGQLQQVSVWGNIKYFSYSFRLLVAVIKVVQILWMAVDLSTSTWAPILGSRSGEDVFLFQQHSSPLGIFQKTLWRT